jgi:hypothetical protein
MYSIGKEEERLKNCNHGRCKETAQKKKLYMSWEPGYIGNNLRPTEGSSQRQGRRHVQKVGRQRSANDPRADLDATGNDTMPNTVGSRWSLVLGVDLCSRRVAASQPTPTKDERNRDRNAIVLKRTTR